MQTGTGGLARSGEPKSVSKSSLLGDVVEQTPGVLISCAAHAELIEEQRIEGIFPR